MQQQSFEKCFSKRKLSFLLGGGNLMAEGNAAAAAATLRTTQTSEEESVDTSDEQLSSEDEYAKKLTKKLDTQIARTYQLLKTKDPSIYNKQTQFYSEEEASSVESDEEPIALVYKRKTMDANVHTASRKEEADGEHSKAHKTTTNVSLYDPEQMRLKREISNIMNALEETDQGEDELFSRKDDQNRDMVEEQQWIRSIQEAERNETAEEFLLHSYLEKETPDEAERFLRDYVLNDGWIKNISEAPLLNNNTVENMEIDEDSEFVEKQEEYEATYNFRFEEPNSTEIVSYGRNVTSSFRPKESKRKKKRDRREMRKKEKKESIRKDWEPLKKEKQEKILDRIKELLAFCKARGVSYFSLIEQDEELDMYQHRQKVKAILDERGESCLIEELESNHTAKNTGVGLEGCRETVLEMDRLIDEYFELELEDVVGDSAVRFRYRAVEPETFGLETTDILAMDEAELNRLVPLQYVTSYVRPKGLSRIRNAVKRMKKRGQFHKESANRKKETSRRNNNTLKHSVNGLQLSEERMKAYGLSRVTK